MQSVSNEYKLAMNQPFRNRAHIRATIGIIDIEAQKSAMTLLTNWEYAPDYNDATLGKSVKTFYATNESNFSKVDGSMRFSVPAFDVRPGDYYYQGAVTDSPSGQIDFRFSDGLAHTINGLTIDFTEFYPHEIVIFWGNNSRTYSVDSQFFKTNDVFENVTSLFIQQTNPVEPYRLFRIASITFGHAKVFSDDDVISYSQDDYISVVSEDLPTRDMVLVVNNRDGSFDPDNENSEIYSLMEKQPMTVQFGYDLDENGDEIEWVEPTVGFMSEWSATESEATLKATDMLAFLDNEITVDKHPNSAGKLLCQIAEEVLTDLDVDHEVSTTSINSTKNGMESEYASEVIQNVANACGYIIRFDRDGKIVVSEESDDIYIQGSSDSESEYSSLSYCVDRDTKVYAIGSSNSASVDGKCLFAPTSPLVLYENIGFTGDSVAGADGTYPTEQKITFQQVGGEPIKCNGLEITFNGVAPTHITIVKTMADETVETESFDCDPADMTFVYRGFFDDVSHFDVIFDSGLPGSAIQITRIAIGGTKDFEITRDMILDTPVASMREKIKTINVKKTVDTYESSTSTITTDTRSMTVSDYIELTWDDEYKVSSVTSSNPDIQVTIMDRTAKSVTFFAYVASSGNTTFTVKGYKHKSTDTTVDLTENIDSSARPSSGTILSMTGLQAKRSWTI